MSHRKSSSKSNKNPFLIENILFYALIAMVVLIMVMILLAIFYKRDSYKLEDYLGRDGFFIEQSGNEEPQEKSTDKVRIGLTDKDSSKEESSNFMDIYASLSDSDKKKVNVNFDFTELNSNIYGVYDVSLGKFLLANNADEKVAPASLTKIMTTFLAIEKVSDINKTVDMDQSIFDWIFGKDLSVVGFEKGEKVRLLDLLYGAMLPSGADACLGIARMVSGDQDKFVKEMNQRAAELGMTNTSFKNCVGNDDEGHYSTVRDLVKLFEIAMRNKVFELVASTESYTLKPNSVRKEAINLFSNTFENIYKSYGIPNGVEVIGGKTGYTENARLCLIVEVTKRDQKYIICVLNAGNTDGAARDCMTLADKFLA